MLCLTGDNLLELNFAACTRYINAIDKLVQLVGGGQATSFAEAKDDCQLCLTECRETMNALRAHKADHGC